MASLSSQTYTPEEEAEIKTWTAKCEEVKTAPADPTILSALNNLLEMRTTVLGTKPSKADVAVYEAVAPLVKKWSPDERSGEKGLPNVVRLVDFVQNAPEVYGLEVAEGVKVAVDAEDVRYVKPVVDPKAEKEKLKKEKAAAAAAAAAAGGGSAAAAVPDRTKQEKDKGPVEKVKEKVAEVKDKVKQPKEKKEKGPKPQKAAAAAAPLSPCLIDLRVGHILKAIKHPEADSLYVSTIAMGDAPGTDDTSEHEGQVCRTVCSGLNGLVPLEEMQNRKVVTVCNLKPVKMRGIKSCAMVLAASPRAAEGEDDHKGPVELVNPPEGAAAGERVWFEGWQGDPEGVLNPKKKIWETMQPGFTTTEALEVAFDAGAVKELGKEGLGKLVTASGGVCKVPSLSGAQVR